MFVVQNFHSTQAPMQYKLQLHLYLKHENVCKFPDLQMLIQVKNPSDEEDSMVCFV